MNTAVIITKTEPDVKLKAQKIAHDLGISLSSMINAYLKQVVRTKRISYYLEEPSEYLIKAIGQAEADYKKGKGSPVFKSGGETTKWLEKQGI